MEMPIELCRIINNYARPRFMKPDHGKIFCKKFCCDKVCDKIRRVQRWQLGVGILLADPIPNNNESRYMLSQASHMFIRCNDCNDLLGCECIREKSRRIVGVSIFVRERKCANCITK